MAKVCVLGMGYIGLPAAALAATHGHEVVGVDIKPDVVDSINAGKTHLEEPGLPELVEKAVAEGSLRASINVEPADIFIIAVPTPFIETTKEADMMYVRGAVEAISRHVKEGDLVVLESTSPVGATEKHLRQVLEGLRTDLVGKVGFVYCPERAIPGKTLDEMRTNDRSIGGMTAEATEKAYAFYSTFVTGQLLPTTAATAEMVKLVENASRDAQIAFANELSLVCDEIGINVWDVINLANHHPRVNLLQPGPGVGGHCIAVDPWFIISAAPEQTRLMQAARAVNDGKPDWVVNKIKKELEKSPSATVTLLGLAYKPNVDDFRESPSIFIADKLKEEGVDYKVVEPFMREFGEYNVVHLTEGLKSDIIVMLTDHEIFRENVKADDLKGKTVIDTRGTFKHLV